MSKNEETNIQHIRKIGTGAYGSVYSGLQDLSGGKATKDALYATPNLVRRVALKRILTDKTATGYGSMSEMDICVRLGNHPNITQMFEATEKAPIGSLSPISPDYVNYYRNDPLFFVFEHADCSLMDYINLRRNSAVLKQLMRDILLGVEWMHRNNIMHRDLKPDNVLVFNANLAPSRVQAKLADFGLSKYYCKHEPHTPRVAPYSFRAPEVLMNRPYGYAADIWSCGCMFFQMFSRRFYTPVTADKTEDIHLLATVLRNQHEYYSQEFFSAIFGPNNLPPHLFSGQRPTIHSLLNMDNKSITDFNDSPGKYLDFVDLLGSMLCLDPRRRPSAEECLKHKFFAQDAVYIKQIREQYPVHKSNVIHTAGKIVKYGDAIEIRDNTPTIAYVRSVGISVMGHIFNYRSGIPWYKHRILFHTLDTLDRYLSVTNEFNTKLPLDNIGSTDAYILVWTCFYIWIKFFTHLATIPSFIDLQCLNEGCKGKQALDRVEYFEKDILSKLYPHLYQRTIFEEFDELYDTAITDRQVYEIIYTLCFKPEYIGHSYLSITRAYIQFLRR